jgi:hypothetical protein
MEGLILIRMSKTEERMEGLILIRLIFYGSHFSPLHRILTDPHSIAFYDTGGNVEELPDPHWYLHINETSLSWSRTYSIAIDFSLSPTGSDVSLHNE